MQSNILKIGLNCIVQPIELGIKAGARTNNI